MYAAVNIGCPVDGKNKPVTGLADANPHLSQMTGRFV
jgi:hypothetical protein